MTFGLTFGITFHRVTLLWLLALVPIVLALFLLRERTRARWARRFVSDRLRGGAPPLRGARPWLVALGLAFAVVALAGPYAGYRIIPITAREANRVIVIDVSNSMAAEDVGASRLAAAKAIAMRIAEAQEGRVGLVAFEAQPEVMSPLTTDTAAVAALIDSIASGEVGEPGSDIGGAIISALRLIEAEPAQRADIVVISDGEDQGARIAEAVQRAKSRGIAVSTIAIGTATGATIPTGEGPLRDTSGEVVTTRARADTMQSIAQDTGGTALVNPFGEHAIDPLLGGTAATQRSTQARIPIDRYQWPLGAALFLLLVGSVLHRGAE
jgi:Ca-activated chloride channel homolog